MLAPVLGRERPRRSWSRGRPQSQHQNAKQQREINEGRRRGINYDHVECCELAYLYLVWFHVVYRSARVCMRPRACQCCASCTVIVWIGWMFELFIVSIVVGYIYIIYLHTRLTIVTIPSFFAVMRRIHRLSGPPSWLLLLIM